MSVEILLLGRFAVRVGDREIPPSAWSRRQAAGLVKLLALAPRRLLHREQVMDALWPDVPVDEATPRLHKAAHFARRVLGPDSVALRNESVVLFPDTLVSVDTVRFQEFAQDALDAGDVMAASAAADLYGGPLLPEDRYESWAEASRDRLQLLNLQLLRQARRWADLLEVDTTDAEAHLGLMRDHAARGDRRAALRQFERMERALQGELGVGPDEEAISLRDSLLDGMAGPSTVDETTAMVGRGDQLSTLERLLDEAGRGRGRTVFVAGAAGMGKSMLAAWLRGHAAGRGWRTGHGMASAIEGAWPYAPVLEAIADLCRRHPTLLDGLDDRARHDIDRALAAQTLDWDRDGGHQRLFVAVADLARLAAAGPGVLLTIDDVQEADEASLRLVHYLARSCMTERLVLVLCHRRQPVTDAFEQVRGSLLGRNAAVDVTVAPLDRADCATLVRSYRSDLDEESLDQIWAVSGGVPFAVIGLARAAGASDVDTQRPGGAVLDMLAPSLRAALEPVAITGSTFDTDEFLSLCGLPEEQAYDRLDAALAALVIERTLGGYRFRHPLIRDALLEAIPPHRRRVLHRVCADRLTALDASPARIGHHLLAAGDSAAAVPHVLRAAETAAAVGAYRDALSLVDSIRSAASGSAERRVLALRADLLAAVGDPAAMSVYRDAIAAASPSRQRALRARMARFAILSGDRAAAAAVLDGLEPDGGPEDTAILLAKAEYDTTATPAPVPGPDVVPAQLPPALPQFVGRQTELELLDEALPPGGVDRAAMIGAITGPPGVGKTSLAVAWAHRVAPRFPDGQLYVNLHGFSPQATTLDAADVLHGFLEALGVHPQRIPESLPARIGLYRSLLAGKSMLVLLDNAHDADHVRPLLPGSPACLTVVTSRNKLTSLVATEGATAMSVDVLARRSAHALLTQRLGDKRVAGEPDAVEDIITRCGGLPLALGIVAARAATDPGVSLATIAGQMLAMTDTLDTLSGGDISADVRSVISWSYAALSPDAAGLFRHLALHPCADIAVVAAASLDAVPTARARRLLAALAGANLLIALDNERYTFHDLIRAYALEQAQQDDAEADRSEMMHRLLDHYLHTAHAAAGLLDTYRDAIVSAEPRQGVVPATLADHEQALEWLIAEYSTLLAIIRQAEESGFHAHSWQLACTLTEFFERRGLWHGWLAALTVALSAAERLGDRRALAYSHRGLGRAHQWLGDYAEADLHHRQALAHFTHLGDRLGQARVWHSLGRLAELRGQLEEALSYTQNGLELFRAAGHRPGIAKALNGVGWYHCLLGDYPQALDCCGEALVLLQELGDRRVEANAWDSLAYAHNRAGDHGKAIECYEHALTLFREIGDRFHEGNASVHLGNAYADAGDLESARRMWQTALVILEDLGHADAELVRTKLAAH